MVYWDPLPGKSKVDKCYHRVNFSVCYLIISRQPLPLDKEKTKHKRNLKEAGIIHGEENIVKSIYEHIQSSKRRDYITFMKQE